MSDPTIDSADPLIRRHEKWRTDRIAARLGKTIFLVSEARRHERPWLRWLALRTAGASQALGSARFDGVSTYFQNTSLTGPTGGPADSGQVFGMFTFELGALASVRAAEQMFFVVGASTSWRISVRQQTNDEVRVDIRNTSGAARKQFDTGALSLGVKYNLIFSCDIDLATPEFEAYIAAGAAVHTALDAVVDSATQDTTEWTQRWTLGGRDANPGGTLLADIHIAQLIINNSRPDLSTEALREKFWNTTAGEPRDQGADGSAAIGSQPHTFFQGDTSTFFTNNGSLGADAFPDQNGTYADGNSFGTLHDQP